MRLLRTRSGSNPSTQGNEPIVVNTLIRPELSIINAAEFPRVPFSSLTEETTGEKIRMRTIKRGRYADNFAVCCFITYTTEQRGHFPLLLLSPPVVLTCKKVYSSMSLRGAEPLST